MANCSKTISGIAQDCNSSMGGIKRVWLTATKPTVTVEDGEVTEIGFAESGKTIATEFKSFYFKKNTASMTSTLNVDVANGVNYVSTELALIFSRMDTTKRIEMTALALSDMYGVVEDANGNLYFLGYDEAIYATAGTGQTGTAKTDGNNYQITLTDEANEFPFLLASDLKASFEAI